MRPSLWTSNLAILGPTTLAITLPQSLRYTVTASELVRVRLPASVVSCARPLGLTPRTALAVLKPPLKPLGALPASGPVSGGTRVIVHAVGVSPSPLECLFGQETTVAEPDTFRPGYYRCTSTASVVEGYVDLRLRQRSDLLGLIFYPTQVVEGYQVGSPPVAAHYTRSLLFATTLDDSSITPESSSLPSSMRYCHHPAFFFSHLFTPVHSNTSISTVTARRRSWTLSYRRAFNG